MFNFIRRKNEKGQASLMVAVMMMTFLFFFCFVVNVGMLVNAKIQLQNAADLAAYAGAATQARQLNRISFLNYEMRRQYKKFLFRYYVIGNMAQKDFPTSSAGSTPSTPYNWNPNPPAGAPNYQVPAVCMIFNAQDNYCQVKDLPAIQIPPVTNFDAINDALRNQLQQLESIRKSNCGKIALTNLFVLSLWLYNGDPEAKLDTGLAGLGPEYANAQNIVEGLVKGLGLIPRELILRARIKTLAEHYLNAPPKSVKFTDVQALGNSADPHLHERTIQAFYSAFYTLGNHTFAGDSISMDEIQAPQQIALNNIKTKFDTWAIYFDDSALSSANLAAACVPHLIPQTLKTEFTVGVAKDPNILTYYAVRLKAKAKLLFNPWDSGGIELKAYAAAQPFGSRIGPALTSDAWVRSGAVPGAPVSNVAPGLVFSPENRVPNLPITESDSLDRGWNTREVLGLLMSSAFPSTGPNRTITQTDLGRAYQLAMAPNPYETKLYNIPNDLADYDSAYRFSPGIFDGSRAAILWAPVAPPDSPGGVQTELQSIIEDLFLSVSDGSATKLKDTLKTQLGTYINKIKGYDLQSCGTQKLAMGMDDSDCESFNMVRLTNPFRPRPTASATGPGVLPLPAWFMPQTPKDVQTSWNAPNDPPKAGDAGRLGYSVKFVSFDSLIHGKVASDDKTQTRPSNSQVVTDPEAKVDLNFIQH